MTDKAQSWVETALWRKNISWIILKYRDSDGQDTWRQQQGPNS